MNMKSNIMDFLNIQFSVDRKKQEGCTQVPLPDEYLFMVGSQHYSFCLYCRPTKCEEFSALDWGRSRRN